MKKILTAGTWLTTTQSSFDPERWLAERLALRVCHFVLRRGLGRIECSAVAVLKLTTTFE